MTIFEAIQAVEKADPDRGNLIAVSILTGACNVFMTEDERNRVIKILLGYASPNKEAA